MVGVCIIFLVSVTNWGPRLCDRGDRDRPACIIHEEWECLAVIRRLLPQQSYSQNAKLYQLMHSPSEATHFDEQENEESRLWLMGMLTVLIRKLLFCFL